MAHRTGHGLRHEVQDGQKPEALSVVHLRRSNRSVQGSKGKDEIHEWAKQEGRVLYRLLLTAGFSESLESSSGVAPVTRVGLFSDARLLLRVLMGSPVSPASAVFSALNGTEVSSP